MFKSIQTKILFYIITTTIVALILIGYFSVFTIQRFSHTEVEEGLQNRAELMAQIIGIESEKTKGIINENYYKRLFSKKETNGTAIINATDKNKSINYQDKEIPYNFKDTNGGQNVYKNKKYYVAGVAPIKNSKYMEDWYVVCEYKSNQVYNSINNMATIIIVIIVIAFILLWLLGKRLSFSIQRPIKKLSIDVRQIAEGDISHGIEVAEKNELKIIADSFNKMLDQLKSTMQQVLDKSGEAASMHEVMEYVEQAYDELPSGIISMNNIGEITTFNEGAERLTGLESRNVIGLNINNPTPAEIKNLINPMNRCLAKGSLQLKTLGDIRNTAGERVPIEYSINIQFGAKNEMLGVICLFRSITDIERFEESAQRSKNLGALGEMAASLAHEIKNPLASIRGYTQYVRKDMQLENMSTEEMDIIMHEVDKLTVMLDKFLKFARPDKPDVEICDIRELINYVLKLMEKDVPDNIDVIKNLNQIPPVAIDKNQFEPLLLNLFLNSIQAMPNGGKLIVKTSYEAWRNMVRIDIQDNGIGIPQDLADKIFQPFFTTKETGTGLGLPICSRTIEAHKGMLEVESVEGEMTKFTILLQGKKYEEDKKDV